MDRDVDETAPADPEQASESSLIGRYIYRRPLGRGGMGVVVAAYDPELDREVAIKLITADPVDDERPVREAQAMARLTHPNVARVYEVLRLGDRSAIVMELVDGEELGAWQKRENRSWREIVDAYVQASRGLAAAHRAGIVHRDFKPSNVLVDRDGIVRVTDFGIARRDSREVVSGAVGTPAYMAPEQHSQGVADARSDQWSLACSLYEALYGRRPIGSTGNTGPEPADSPTPRHVRVAIRRALEEDPGKRFATIDDFAAALVATPRRVPIVVATLALALLVSLAVLWTRGEPASCQGLDGPIRALWTDAARTQLRERLSATGVGLPAATIDRALQGIDAYAASWVSMRTRICTDRQQGVISAEKLDARMRCLDHRLSETSGLLEALVGADNATLRATSDAVAQLVPASLCLDHADLAGAIASPKDPALRAEVDDAENGLARANAAISLGQYERALPLVERAITAGGHADTPSLTARALILRGECEDRLGRFDASLASYRLAAKNASRARDHAVVADALSRAFLVEGDHLGRRADALAARPFIELAMDSAGQPNDVRATWLHYLAIVIYDDPGKLEEAVQYERESLAIRRRTLSANHLYIIDSMETLANIEVARGNLEEAERLLQQVLDARIAARGSQDGSVASASSNLGILEFHRGDLLAAMEYFQRAVDISVAAGHPNRGALFNLGVTQWQLGRWRAATTTFTTGLEVSEKVAAESRDVAEAATYLAGTRIVAGDVEEGRPVLARGIEIARRSGSLVLATGLAFAARVALHDKDHEKARLLIDEAAKLPSSDKAMVSLVAAELSRAKDGCTTARPALVRLLESAIADKQNLVRALATVHLAECEIAAGDVRPARDRLEALLAWLAKMGADEAAKSAARSVLATAR
ncbi:MAG: protein kinase domain-containing protein [Kofleriaceae bacterium]